MTPKKLRWGFSVLLATNGYIVFPSWLASLCIQWGKVTVSPTTNDVAVTYPLAFSSVYSVTNSFNATPDGGRPAYIRNVGTNSFIYSVGAGENSNTYGQSFWQAIGVL